MTVIRIELIRMCMIAGLGLVVLVGVFWRMKGGFGPYNLRIVGIVLVATLAALLAARDKDSITAAMGILGAIAGYLFGIRTKSEQAEPSDDGTEQDSGKKK